MKVMHSIFGALAIVLMAAPAHAVVPVWNQLAAACQVSSFSLDDYRTGGHSILHATGDVDPIEVLCSISAPLPAGSQWKLVVTYRDSSGTATSARLLAQLLRKSRTIGGLAGVASFSSDTSPALGITKGSTNFTHTFNFDANIYYVSLSLHRALDTQTVQAIGVSIERGP